MSPRRDDLLPDRRTGGPEPEDQIGKIDINTATREQIMRVEGFDGKSANDLVRYRLENGPFHSVDDLEDIPWLSKGQLSRLREHIDLPGIGGGSR